MPSAAELTTPLLIYIFLHALQPYNLYIEFLHLPRPQDHFLLDELSNYHHQHKPQDLVYQFV